MIPGSLTRSQLLALAAVLLLVLVVGARLVRSGGEGARAESVVVSAPKGASKRTERKLVVHVVGAVRRPGLYRLEDGSRIADAVARAGGHTRRADLTLLNLAAPLADGLQVVVPRRVAAAAPGHGPAAGPASAGGPVHLNTATLEQLDSLPGVGPVTAQKILDFRQENGGFTSVDELDAVPGIGPSRLENLREAVAP